MIITPGQLRRRAELYHQLGSMLSAGVPLIRALQMVVARPELRASRDTILGLVRRLESGLTFSESMVQVQGWLPDFDIALLTAGEESGRLDVSFRLLADYYATRAKIIRDTILGLLVTTATLHVFLLVFPLNLMVNFVLGIFNGQYAQCIPFLIQKAVVFGVLYGAVFLLIYACQGRHGEPWRAVVESVARCIPILRTARKYLVLSRLAAALEALISAGVSIIKAWDLAGAASGSPRLHREVSTWKTELERGFTPTELINKSGYFPDMFANLYATGEHSGKLDETLERLRDYYQEEGFRKLRVFTYVMNGTIYGLVALLVAFYVISFYMEYFGTIFENVGGL